MRRNERGPSRAARPKRPLQHGHQHQHHIHHLKHKHHIHEPIRGHRSVYFAHGKPGAPPQPMLSLPGLGLSGPPPDADDAPDEQLPTRLVTLAPGSEWRFENAFAAKTTVRVRPLTDEPYSDDDAPSLAEMFGTELVPSADYVFSGTKAAIFSHDGCHLDVSGARCDSDYVADETPMAVYANVHFALESLRSAAAAARARAPDPAGVVGGPRVLVCGPDNAGKTSLVKLLAAYAARAGRSPCVVSLDPREPMLCLPGSVSAAVFGPGAQLDVTDATAGGGWGSSGVQGGAAGGASAAARMPLVYHYGDERVEHAPDVFLPVASRLAVAATSRFEEDPPVKDAGFLVDLAGSACTGKGGYAVLDHVVSEFSISVVLVLGSERVYSDLAKRYPAAAGDPDRVQIVKLPRSGGCVDRDAGYMAALANDAVKSYFFGSRRVPLSPHTLVLDLAGFQVLRMADAADAELESAFRAGDADAAAPIYTLTTLGLAATHTLLTVKHAGMAEAHETIRDAAVLGYLYVAEVDAEKKRVRVLSPVGGRLPERAIVWGRWPVDVGELVG